MAGGGQESQNDNMLKKKKKNDKVLASILPPTIRNSRSWGMGRMPVWLPDGWGKAGRTQVNRAHLKVGSVNTKRREAW